LSEIFQIAWKRFNLIALVMGDVNGRVIITVFYFTILLPFGIISRLLTDPLRQRDQTAHWLDRPAVPEDVDSARLQG
jgi:hypothetical protein